MENYIHTIQTETLSCLQHDDKFNALYALENGKVIYLPKYTFAQNENEHDVLSESILHPKHKNLSYDYTKQRFSGFNNNLHTEKLAQITQDFMHRFACFAKDLVDNILPKYSNALQWGRTSFRPAEIKGRKSSIRKDDTRLHIDSFAATPVNGLRILRVFCNINPHNIPRVWNLGESFPRILQQFAHKIPRFNKNKAKLLKLIHVTKTVRSPYDHCMLNLHDMMKLDETYQNTAPKFRINFPAHSSWIVFTDQASHAVLSGQFLLEQTFYLPVIEAMHSPELSPLKQLLNYKSLSY